MHLYTTLPLQTNITSLQHKHSVNTGNKLFPLFSEGENINQHYTTRHKHSVNKGIKLFSLFPEGKKIYQRYAIRQYKYDKVINIEFIFELKLKSFSVIKSQHWCHITILILQISKQTISHISVSHTTSCNAFHRITNVCKTKKFYTRLENEKKSKFPST